MTNSGMARGVLAQAVLRDAEALLEAFRRGYWVPDPAERELAEDLAHGRWDAHFLRAALRELPASVRGRTTYRCPGSSG